MGATKNRKVDSRIVINLRDTCMLEEAIKERKPFHSRKASGFGERHERIIGKYIMQAQFEPCPICHKYYDEGKEEPDSYRYPYYVIYSYETAMYGHCGICNNSYIDANFYSDTTRILQNAIASAVFEYKLALDEQKEIEKIATEKWHKDRAKGIVSTHRILRYNGFGRPVYAKNANLFEMLEHYHGHKLVGHWIHNEVG